VIRPCRRKQAAVVSTLRREDEHDPHRARGAAYRAAAGCVGAGDARLAW
jgi:hypothetical protein